MILCHDEIMMLHKGVVCCDEEFERKQHTVCRQSPSLEQPLLYFHVRTQIVVPAPNINTVRILSRQRL